MPYPYTFSEWLSDSIMDAEDVLAARKATSGNRVYVLLAQARLDILEEVADEFQNLPAGEPV